MVGLEEDIINTLKERFSKLKDAGLSNNQAYEEISSEFGLTRSRVMYWTSEKFKKSIMKWKKNNPKKIKLQRKRYLAKKTNRENRNKYERKYRRVTRNIHKHIEKVVNKDELFTAKDLVTRIKETTGISMKEETFFRNVERCHDKFALYPIIQCGKDGPYIINNLFYETIK